MANLQCPTKLCCLCFEPLIWKENFEGIVNVIICEMLGRKMITLHLLLCLETFPYHRKYSKWKFFLALVQGE